MNTLEELALARRIADARYACNVNIEPLSRFNNPVFRLTLADGERILKIAKSTGGAATRKETALIARLGRKGVPVAELEFVDGEGAEFGRPYFLMNSAGRETVAERLGHDASTQSLLTEMGLILARIHSLPSDSFADAPADRISAQGVAGYLDSLMASAEVLAQQRLLDKREIERFRALPLPRAQGNSLCHSDYHAVQCIVRDDRVSAVVDWESAWIGNPLIDLAISHAYLDFYCPPPLTKAFLVGYLSVRAIPADYATVYLPVRMIQVLAMMRAWYTRGPAAWQAAIDQQKVARAVRLFRVYADRLGR